MVVLIHKMVRSHVMAIAVLFVERRDAQGQVHKTFAAMTFQARTMLKLAPKSLHQFQVALKAAPLAAPSIALTAIHSPVSLLAEAMGTMGTGQQYLAKITCAFLTKIQQLQSGLILPPVL